MVYGGDAVIAASTLVSEVVADASGVPNTTHAIFPTPVSRIANTLNLLHQPQDCVKACSYTDRTWVTVITMGNVCWCTPFEEFDFSRLQRASTCNVPCREDETLTCGGYSSYDLYLVPGGGEEIGAAVPGIPVTDAAPGTSRSAGDEFPIISRPDAVVQPDAVIQTGDYGGSLDTGGEEASDPHDKGDDQASDAASAATAADLVNDDGDRDGGGGGEGDEGGDDELLLPAVIAYGLCLCSAVCVLLLGWFKLFPRQRPAPANGAVRRRGGCGKKKRRR